MLVVVDLGAKHGVVRRHLLRDLARTDRRACPAREAGRIGAVLVVHGGAGRAPAPGRAAAKRRGIDAALAAGLAILRDGGSALDTVCAAVVVLEDDLSFNAGRGSVPTTANTYECDAAVMVGANRRAGAVAAVTGIKNAVLAARAVMEHGEHVLVAGPGAGAFAVERAPAGWFDVERGEAPSPGTVGAVALDAHGHLAAATSTGGRSGQLPGRVGDSPVIGAGTWADDRTCAVSGTGHGEAFVRAAFAHSVHVAVLAGVSLAEACTIALDDVASLGGRGGCIAVARSGEVAGPFTTDFMSWGQARPTT